MPTTAKTDFESEMIRLFVLHAKAHALEIAGDVPQVPRDIRGAAVAMAIGAMDNCFCERYVDCLKLPACDDIR